MQWRIVTYRLSGEASRHRVAAWRELRRVGAVALQSATWAVPTGDGFDDGLAKTRRLIERAQGQMLVFDVDPASESLGELARLFTDERESEWLEFLAECDKAVAELRSEFAKEKFTLAELDEEEHNVDRLRRWSRDLRAKDVFGAPSAADAEVKLKGCVELLEDFAEQVYEARRAP